VPVDRDLLRNWKAILGRLEIALPAQFPYLRGSVPQALENGSLRVGVASTFACAWLEQNLATRLGCEATRQWGFPVAVAFAPQDVPSLAVSSLLACPETPPPAVLTGKPHPQNTFARYIVGEGNRLAFEAATALVEEDSWRPSPLFVAGPSGVGKTHLLEALAWRAHEKGWPVVCLRWEEFIGRFVDSVRGHGNLGFKDRVREAKMLIVDDLQDASGAPKTADELVNAIDCVEAGLGAVVLSAEQLPERLGLPGRLVSRIRRGLITEVRPFDASERQGYAEAFRRRTGADLPEWAISRIVSEPALSVRTLCGSLNEAVALLRTGRLERDALEAVLVRQQLGARAKTASPETLLRLAAEHFGIAPSDLTGESRLAPVRQARAAVAATLRERGLSVNAVAKELGRAKSTIPGLCETGERLLAADAGLRAKLAG
jgi:chromosomal replication initiator protein